ncbi:hypothetical protein O6H91_08G082900 [Diphasiastrum complanatum]|uniref:Uncharacterized protein n=2 Tax=Diphasiastrum complanatum TaxID=34168 RepID=A0ACC2CZE7_DIPCM|nr:hypothetical protein O6H91_08G082900 [Diphasiastrum complanatum]KAJ7547378.1 hypothetical protein O6H91_08G082900 [Diphasiastrum complanatum]
MIFGFGGSAVVALVLCSMKYFLNRKHRKTPNRKESKADDLQSISYSSSDLQHATSNFHPNNKLGRGEYGEVYKGVLEDGTEVAVKKLTTKPEQGARHFMDTVKLITSIQHQNLIKLTGWCLEGGQKLLVYEYLEQRNLAQILLNQETKVDIGWQIRFNIAFGIARGLAYLHEFRPQIIHGDLKASNILLDKSFHPKIGDYALRNLFPDKDNSLFGTHVAENLGYVAPEYILQGQLTEKVDTFSFGVLVLEIISGRSNINRNLTREQTLLLEWAWKLYKETRLADLVDPNLGKDYSEDEIFRLIHVALLCTQSSPATRPSMIQVLAMINGDDDITVFPSRPGILHKLLESLEEGPSTHQIKTNAED